MKSESTKKESDPKHDEYQEIFKFPPFTMGKKTRRKEKREGFTCNKLSVPLCAGSSGVSRT